MGENSKLSSKVIYPRTRFLLSRDPIIPLMVQKKCVEFIQKSIKRPE